MSIAPVCTDDFVQTALACLFTPCYTNKGGDCSAFVWSEYDQGLFRFRG